MTDQQSLFNAPAPAKERKAAGFDQKQQQKRDAMLKAYRIIAADPEKYAGIQVKLARQALAQFGTEEERKKYS